MAEKRVRVIALGGVREIGKNSTVVEYGGEMVLVDAGVRFPEEELRGVDLLVPDVSYIQQHRDRLRALLLTHGHEDHIGAVPYILPLLASDRPLPIYGSPLTVGFVREKLRELSRGRHGLPAYGALVERTKESVGRSIYRTTRKRPLIMPMVAEV